MVVLAFLDRKVNPSQPFVRQMHQQFEEPLNSQIQKLPATTTWGQLLQIFIGNDPNQASIADVVDAFGPYTSPRKRKQAIVDINQMINGTTELAATARDYLKVIQQAADIIKARNAPVPPGMNGP